MAGRERHEVSPASGQRSSKEPRAACAKARQTYAASRRAFIHSMTTGLERNPGPTKEFWRAINAAMDRLRSTSLPTLLHNGHELKSSRAKAATLNNVREQMTVDD